MESRSLPEARQALETRLASLARTHAMLADSGWAGASLKQIVSEELTTFASQFDCTGCDLVLNTPAAQSFALIVHELATNAVKHGALSKSEGRVAISGSLTGKGDELFRFAWCEYGGPAVHPPRRRGFGSSILDTMANRFACSVQASYHPEGLVYTLEIPVGSLEAAPSFEGTFWRQIARPLTILSMVRSVPTRATTG